MQKIVHISDLHFGTEVNEIVSHLMDAINNFKPDAVVVSGDLTQRAKKKEYHKAKNFLKKLDCPTVVIPGNHDIPLYNIFGRIVNPFKKFESYFSTNDQYYAHDRYPFTLQ